MAIHNDFGKEAEKEAQKYLRNKGYSILETNWRFHQAEIDIIALYRSYLVIVEVKGRSGNSLISPEEAVNVFKKKLLIDAANRYAENYPEEINVRFDIISLIRNENRWQVNHIEDAFEAIL
ncbi:endonuclease [Apibacter muscae]|uniref:YraN family protein n=1 Tax=Apibacter muscae TaxID=2509004 RepID=UPI0011AD107C|nr:YraN family protein [Apibacter muscae]TWP30348.1 endonuclease [Apibacter muscae]